MRHERRANGRDEMSKLLEAYEVVDAAQKRSRLIAAAPELLEALQGMIAKATKWHPTDPVLVAARAAIAKATGETK